MAIDLGADIRISEKATEASVRFTDEGWFATRKEAAMFAAAYVIKYKFEEFDPSTYVIPDQAGTNWSYYGFDEGGYWEELIRNLYDTETPKLFMRNIMNYGLELIGEDIEKTGILQIQKYI